MPSGCRRSIRQKPRQKARAVAAAALLPTAPLTYLSPAAFVRYLSPAAFVRPMPSPAACGAGGQERDRREFFALKPLNQLTWPELARQYLCAATQYRQARGGCALHPA